MSEEVKIDKTVFQTRLSQLIQAWKTDKRSSGDSLFGGVHSLLVLTGKNEDTPQNFKSNALHTWLLGYEFPATLMVFTTDCLYIVTTAKKAKHLEPLKGGKIALELLVRGKDADENTKQFEKCNEIIKSAGNKVGVLKDAANGPFADEWRKTYSNILKDVEEFDIATALSSAAFSIKDESELRNVRDAARASTGLLQEYFVEEMSSILDEEKNITHQQLADKIDLKLDDARFFKNMKIKTSSDFDHSQLDWTYGPTIQSGAEFDLKISASANSSNLHAGVILAGLGLRFKGYSSMIARTFMVDPTSTQEKNYKVLQEIQEMLIREACDGAVVKDLYAKALDIIRKQRPELEKHFLRTIGGGIGFELRDSTLLLNSKDTRTLKDGMTLTLAPGFTDIENKTGTGKKNKLYSLFVCDTVRVLGRQIPAASFTSGASTDLGSISFFFKDDEEAAAPKDDKPRKKDPKVGAVATTNVVSSRLRADRGKQVDEDAEARRREHQKELADKKQREGLATYNQATDQSNGVQQKKFKKFESYRTSDQLPSRIADLAVFVDAKAATVILPIMGRPVPYHINTIKNASTSDEGDFTFLRLNFLSPGQGIARKDDQPFEDATAHFVRSLTFRSKDTSRMEGIVQQITDLRKNAVRKEQEKKVLEDVVQQDKLVEIRNRRIPPLDNVYLRPGLHGKRVPGEVQIHQNGLRYSDARGQQVDVLFGNMKHLFFQPCLNEMIVVIHIHLIDPIMIGKKKTKDVQFYREATDMAFDETGNRKRKHRYGDEEEIEQEQEERRKRAALDKMFKKFAEQIQAASPENGVDIPFRELGFYGVPFRSNVLLQPTQDCLVQLTEPPFTVLTLDELEIVHLERVQFGLKNFDMVYVFKDFHKAPIHINTIPVESLEMVKDWLDSVDLPFNEGPLNLNWTTIMKTVIADPHQFFKDGGWSFLSVESDNESQEESEEESAFEVSGSDLGSEPSTDEESEFDDDASADEGSEASLDESGEDWDDLEEKAKRKDRESNLEDDDDDKPRRKKH